MTCGLGKVGSVAPNGDAWTKPCTLYRLGWISEAKISLGASWSGWRRVEHTNHEVGLHRTGNSLAQRHGIEGTFRKVKSDYFVVRRMEMMRNLSCCFAQTLQTRGGLLVAHLTGLVPVHEDTDWVLDAYCGAGRHLPRVSETEERMHYYLGGDIGTPVTTVLSHVEHYVHRGSQNMRKG